MIFKVKINVTLELIKAHIETKGFKNVNLKQDAISFSGRDISSILFFSQLDPYNCVDEITITRENGFGVVNLNISRFKKITMITLALFGLVFYKVYDLRMGYLIPFFVFSFMFALYKFSVWTCKFRIKHDLEKLMKV